jgi:hypothetical protein
MTSSSRVSSTRVMERDARTVSIEQRAGDGEGEAYTIADEAALIRTEAGASLILASRCANARCSTDGNRRCESAVAATQMLTWPRN